MGTELPALTAQGSLADEGHEVVTEGRTFTFTPDTNDFPTVNYWLHRTFPRTNSKATSND